MAHKYAILSNKSRVHSIGLLEIKANQASFKIRHISQYQNDKKSPEYPTYTEITAL